MRIVTWNCNMAFRKKASFILSAGPDILVVPECEHPDKITFGSDTPLPSDMLWFGTNRNKGLGIFVFKNFTMRLHDAYNPDFKWVVPVVVTNSGWEATLFAIWANNPDDEDGQYVEQIWKAINYYDKYLTNSRSILIGDFNSNTIWDREHRIGSHSDLVRRLAEKEIHSCYHHYFDQEHGKERHPTFYLHRNKRRPYHIDYCFASKELVDPIESVEVGNFQEWTKQSDHVPVIVTFKLRFPPPFRTFSV
jgi:exodeoxyribonuclease-3